MDRVVLVTKPTRLDELLRQHFTHGAAQFALESRGGSIAPYEAEDAAYRRALDAIRRQIPSDVAATEVSREDLPNFLFRDKDLILACGPDGLFVNLAKYVGDQPVLTVNPDAATIAGALMLFSPQAAGTLIARALEGKHRVELLPFVKAAIDEDRIEWGIGDIFLGRRDQISARYEISFDGKSEQQSSSGVIVSTGVGASGWLRAVAAMAAGLAADAKASPLAKLPAPTSAELVFVVREPFPAPNSQAGLVTGRILPDKPLLLRSHMPAGGCIFSDGVVERVVEWNAGGVVTLSVGERFLRRIVG